MDENTPQKAKILIVDDSKLIRAAADKILKDDYEVVLANDGEQGWQIIEADEAVRVVFSDLTMPKLDGFALLKRVRQSTAQRVRDLPLIIMTTDADDESRRETALQLGATDFISKPFNSLDMKARAKAHVTSENITRALKQKADELERNASKDPLSGLNNKSYLLEKLWQDSSYARRHHAPLCLVRLDIAEFNRIFIECGKTIANQVISHVANCIRNCLHKEHTAARIGLSAFVVVLLGSSANEAQNLVKSVRDLVAKLLPEHTGIPGPVALSAAILAPNLERSIGPDVLLQHLEQMAFATLPNEMDHINVDDQQTQARITPILPIISLDVLLTDVYKGQGSDLQVRVVAVRKQLEDLLEHMPIASLQEIRDWISKKIEPSGSESNGT